MPTTECISPIELQFQGRHTIVRADGQQVSSDGGVILLRQVDERLGLTQRMSALLGAATRGHQRAELRPSLAGRAEHPRGLCVRAAVHTAVIAVPGALEWSSRLFSRRAPVGIPSNSIELTIRGPLAYR